MKPKTQVKPRPSLIGMKDIDGTYILCRLDNDYGFSNTSLVLLSNIDYVSVKNMLKYDYKSLTGPVQLETMRAYERKDLAVYTAEEMDDLIERNPEYLHTYIFYPKERLWQVYELPSQSPIYKFP